MKMHDITLDSIPSHIASRFTKKELETFVAFWRAHFEGEEDVEYNDYFFDSWVKAKNDKEAYLKVYNEVLEGKDYKLYEDFLRFDIEEDNGEVNSFYFPMR